MLQSLALCIYTHHTVRDIFVRRFVAKRSETAGCLQTAERPVRRPRGGGRPGRWRPQSAGAGVAQTRAQNLPLPCPATLLCERRCRYLLRRSGPPRRYGNSVGPTKAPGTCQTIGQRSLPPALGLWRWATDDVPRMHASSSLHAWLVPPPSRFLQVG